MIVEMNYRANTGLKKVGLIFLNFIGLYAVTFLLYPQSEWNSYQNLSLGKIFFDFISTLLLSICITELCLYIDRRMNKSLPWTKNAMSRLLFQTIVQLISVMLLFVVFTIFIYVAMVILNVSINSTNGIDNEVWYFVITFVCFTLIISGINTVDYLVEQWKVAVLNAAEYKINAAQSKQLAAETELQALRLQLDPHFVFNSLSVLSELILKDQQLGFEYTENFTKVYRYLLVNSKKKVITLQKEFKFLDAYLFLLKSRVGTGAIFEIDVPESQMNLKIPPVTLQLLVENALKYNRIEKENPLLVKIFTNESDELIIYNNVLPLLKKPHSAGIGLENIFSRYALLSDRKPEVEKNETSFIVKIPLL